MRTRAAFSAFFILAFITLVAVSDSQAQVPRTYVSETGNDVYPCDRLQHPCRSIQAAVDKVSDKGEVLVVSSGIYEPFNVKKSLLIAAAPGVDAAVFVRGQENCPWSQECVGIFVKGSPSNPVNVVLRGLRLIYTGPSSPGWRVRGVLFSAEANGSCRIENCFLRNFPTSAIFALGKQGSVSIDNTTLVNNGTAIEIGSNIEGGLVIAAIEQCRIEGNVDGLWVRERSQVTMRNTIIANNKFGIDFGAIDNTSAELTVENCMITGNFAGIWGVMPPGQFGVNSLATARVSNSTITNNQIGLGAALFTEILSRIPAGNTVEGNIYNGSFTGMFQAK